MVENLPAKCRRHRFDPWVEKIPWRRKWQPTPVFLPGKSHGQKSLAGYSPRVTKELRHNSATKQLPRNVSECLRFLYVWEAENSLTCQICSIYPSTHSSKHSKPETPVFDTIWNSSGINVSVSFFGLKRKNKNKNIRWVI